MATPPATAPAGPAQPAPLTSPVDGLDMGDDPLAGADASADGEFDVTEQDDGTATVSLPEDDSARDDPDFSENMAEYLPADVLNELGQDQADFVESDRRSRKKRDEQYSDGIKRTGLGDEAPGGADFDGASRAVHPMLTKGCVDFASRAIKELFPASGPCKTQIVGESTDAKVDKADRKRRYMNWQLTTRVSEQRGEFERLLSQLPLGGSQYKRWWWDDALKRPRTETVYVDDVFLPYSQSDFYSSYRVTHRQWVGADEYESRIDSGLYRDLNLSPASQGHTDLSESKRATDKVEGNEEDGTAYNDEGLREVYMLYVDLQIDDDEFTDGRSAPYILHIENDTQKVLGLYRNWDQKDDGFTKKHWMVEYAFIPWRGAYALGLAHLIGGLSGAATGALRALLDSAHISNFPGGLKLKGGRNSGQSVSVNATELAEIDAPAGVDDIRKLVMPFPFNGPSPVLFQILDWLTTQGEGVISTASESIADAGANMPVGTALAMIEHGSTNFSAVHSRCHASFKREMEILHRLDAENMLDEETVEELGDLVASRQDFQGPMDVVPVSDPNIFSEAQRYAQAQAVLQLKSDPDFRPLFKLDRTLAHVLKTLQVPSPELLANLPKDPTKLGPLQENFIIVAPEPAPIKVYPDQDHLSHIKAHLTFLTSPMFGANPLIGPIAFPPMMDHIKDHLMALYKEHASAAADAAAMVGHSMGKPMPRAHAEMQGAAFADQQLAQLLAPLMPVLAHAQQMAQQYAQKPQPSPDTSATLAAQAQAQQATLAAQAQTTQQTLAAQAQQQQANLAAQAQKDAADRAMKVQLRSMELQYEQQRDAANNEQNDRATVMATAAEKNASDMANSLEMMKSQAKKDSEENAAALQVHLQQMRDDAAANLAILNGTLAQNAAAPQPDTTAMLQPLLDQMNGTTQQMLTQLQDGLAGVQAAHSAPRVARYIKDANGQTTGIESVVQPSPQGSP